MEEKQEKKGQSYFNGKFANLVNSPLYDMQMTDKLAKNFNGIVFKYNAIFN